ncbi:GNAT family N-acetyltransferase [Methylobacterium sp. NMS14P]|uniref:GNAT family N-acetyltransferase n=1 Tax=Methylobacterium sp. NMS14P TaxID=2894310 RepID=UPI0023581E3E|nr:GNAT family N-acetyltransferase [Methylobacterium sp. NMS14P]WCS23805.1 GNAT family N-acetyltransferase [Methylobacterium sp. NMS14P]
MELPSLPPDLSFPRLGNNADDINFAFQAKRSALGPHIAARWGWDEALQRRVHEERYAAKPFFAIQHIGQRIGTISIEILPTHMRLGEFYLLPMFQGKGRGGSILQHFIGLAEVRNIPIRLKYLYWNPVGRLYRRFGFVELTRSEAHCFMERPPAS